jgi:hypothetical protein
MTWFNIIKDDIKSNLKEMFPNAKIKLIGNTWKLLFKKEKDFNNALDFIRTEKEDMKSKWNVGTTTHKDLWIINFENKELEGWV